jgi:thymidylate synthase, flavin-dependent
MRVKLIAHTIVVDNIPGYIPHEYPPTPSDDLGEQAGRLCYLSWDRPNPATSTNDGYLGNIIDQRHFSVMEHASASFYLEDVSRAFLLELERHRHLSYSVVSQRYVDATQFDMTEHPELKKLSKVTKIRIHALHLLAKKLYVDIVKELTELGDKRKTARGAARTVLPEGLETRLLVTGNMRAWRDMLDQRLSESADSEIRQVSMLILEHLQKIAPGVFQDFY